VTNYSSAAGIIFCGLRKACFIWMSHSMQSLLQCASCCADAIGTAAPGKRAKRRVPAPGAGSLLPALPQLQEPSEQVVLFPDLAHLLSTVRPTFAATNQLPARLLLIRLHPPSAKPWRLHTTAHTVAHHTSILLCLWLQLESLGINRRHKQDRDMQLTVPRRPLGRLQLAADCCSRCANLTPVAASLRPTSASMAGRRRPRPPSQRQRTGCR